MRAGRNLARGRLDEAAAHLAVFESHAETTPPDRRRWLRVAIASLKLSLATRRGSRAHVLRFPDRVRCADEDVVILKSSGFVVDGQGGHQDAEAREAVEGALEGAQLGVAVRAP